MTLERGPILVHTPHWLGDAVMATSLISSLAAVYPDHPIDAFGNASAGAVTSGHPALRDYHAYADGAPLAGRLRAARHLRAVGYAASVSLSPSVPTAIAARLIGAQRRAGFTGVLRDMIYDRRLRREPRGTRHLIDEYRALGSVLGAELTLAEPLVVVSEGARAPARQLVGNTAYIVVAPGATYGPAKRWSSTRFAKAAAAIAGPRDWQVIVIGAPGDSVACRAVAGSIGTIATNLCGRTRLDELIAVLAGAELALANDSGPMHLAAAIGTPVLGLFGSSEPGWTAPVGGLAVTSMPRPPCAPCYQRSCTIGYVCLEDLEVDQVLDGVDTLLERQR